MNETSPKIQIYEDRAGEYRWRLVGGNGEKQAAGEGHSTREHAREAVASTARNFAFVCGFGSVQGEIREGCIEELSLEEAAEAGLEV